MSKSILELEPANVWKHFSDICGIYRESGHEQKIREFLISFADGLGLSHRTDAKGNLVIKKPVSNSKSTRTVVLQAHMDMVCVRSAESGFDFTNDAIVPVVDGDWVTARDETTLGADDGMSIAAYMSIMEAKDLVHGPLEFLFTAEEETGLHGATAMDSSLLTGRVLINTDSEEDGFLTIGCAGEETLIVSQPVFREAAPKGMEGLRLQIKGLLGGHSGMEIVKQRANAIKLMARIFTRIDSECDVRLVDFDGGVRRNAIPDRAVMSLAVKESDMEKALAIISECGFEMQNEYSVSDPGLKVAHENHAFRDVISRDEARLVMDFLSSVYNGAVRMSDAMPGLVETSTNVGVAKMGVNHFDVQISTRSAVESEKRATNDSIRSMAKLCGMEIKTSGGYPGWKPDVDSKLLELTKKTYAELFGAMPRVVAVHAGLECGIIGGKFPGMDMISYGPEIQGAHSVNEKVGIKSVEKFYRLTIELLRKLA